MKNSICSRVQPHRGSFDLLFGQLPGRAGARAFVASQLTTNPYLTWSRQSKIFEEFLWAFEAILILSGLVDPCVRARLCMVLNVGVEFMGS